MSTDSGPRKVIHLSKNKMKRERSSSPDNYRASKSQRKHENQRTSVGEEWALSEYDCNLDFMIADDGLSASTKSQGGFAWLWSGGRSTLGITGGKYAFECTVTENTPVHHMRDTKSRNQNIMRVGWSLISSDVGCLGETDTSFGFGGTGIKSTAKKFDRYGKPFGPNDVIGCLIDLEDDFTISFTKNGTNFGVAFKIPRRFHGQAFFPSLLLKNVNVYMNFGDSRDSSPQNFPPPDFEWLEDAIAEDVVSGPEAPDSVRDCECIMLVGLPAAGKTTWAEKYVRKHPEKMYNVIGTNAIISQMKVSGLKRMSNYRERWDVLIKKSSDIFKKLLPMAGRKKRNIILDQTNVYPKARRRKLGNFRDHRKICKCFVPPDEILTERREKAEKFEDKIVPDCALNGMKANFAVPQLSPQEFEQIDWMENDPDKAKKLIAYYNRVGKAGLNKKGGHRKGFWKNKNKGGIGYSGGAAKYKSWNKGGGGGGGWKKGGGGGGGWKKGGGGGKWNKGGKYH